MSDNRTVRVIFTGNAKEEFDKLNQVIGEEVSARVTNSDNQILFNAIKQKIEFLKNNPQYGIHISQNKIPKEYLEKYHVNNLWKANLSGAWRMIYTLRGDKVEILAIILDLLSHPDYDKKFKYKKG